MRYARGAQRRTALVTAAADLVIEHGLGALSHRVVAARAGLPLASTTYYFTSADDLRDEALSHIAEESIACAAAALATLPPRCAPGGRRPRDRRDDWHRHPQGADAPAIRALPRGRQAPPPGPPRHRLEHPPARGRRPSPPTGISAPDPESTAFILALADGAAVTALAEGTAPHDAVTTALTRAFALLIAQPHQ